MPPDLLMDMMETRERMEDAIAENNLSELDKLRAWANEQRDTHLKKIASLFAKHQESLAPDTAKSIRLELNTLRYIQRMLDQMPGGS
ncbi:MAG: iron-sulfur cluster co-chaperone HscB C-terminal domain-containing protein [Phycisphaerales bacterium]